MRNAFADELLLLANGDPRVVMLSGDIGNRLFDRFRAAHSERFFNCGVAEANMVGVAAGLAMTGLLPFVYTIAPFATTRCLEQIRTDVCYHDLPVTIVAVGAGLSYAGLGPTHHACEDIAFMRALPNMTVVCPGDPWEVRAALRAALGVPHPVYLRMGKKGEPLVHGAVPNGFAIGRAITVTEGEQLCLLVTGTMLPEALSASSLLEEAGLTARVVSFHTVKPLDEACLTDVFARFSVIATIEEHSLIGGFGAAVAEWLVDRRVDTRALVRIGIRDAFFKRAGGPEYAREQLGLTAPQIAARLTAAWQRAETRPREA